MDRQCKTCRRTPCQANYCEAESLLRGALRGREQLLGHTHPKTLHVVNKLAQQLEEQGNRDEAERYFRRFRGDPESSSSGDSADEAPDVSQVEIH